MFKKMLFLLVFVNYYFIAAENLAPKLAKGAALSAFSLLNAHSYYTNTKKGLNAKRLLVGVGLFTAMVVGAVAGEELEVSRVIPICYGISGLAACAWAGAKGVKDVIWESENKKVDDGLQTVFRAGIFGNFNFYSSFGLSGVAWFLQKKDNKLSSILKSLSTKIIKRN